MRIHERLKLLEKRVGRKGSDIQFSVEIIDHLNFDIQEKIKLLNKEDKIHFIREADEVDIYYGGEVYHEH